VDSEVEVLIKGPVEADGEGRLIVVMRVMKGDLRPGTRLDRVRGPDGDERPASLTVRRMWLYTREADLIDPPHAGKLELSGDAGGELAPGFLLVRYDQRFCT
jgi:hypothetical protein